MDIKRKMHHSKVLNCFNENMKMHSEKKQKKFVEHQSMKSYGSKVIKEDVMLKEKGDQQELEKKLGKQSEMKDAYVTYVHHSNLEKKHQQDSLHKELVLT